MSLFSQDGETLVSGLNIRRKQVKADGVTSSKRQMFSQYANSDLMYPFGEGGPSHWTITRSITEPTASISHC